MAGAVVAVKSVPISSILSHASAIYLAALGLALLFGSDVVLPTFVPDFPTQAVWLGQLLGGAWLGVALTNWNGRKNILGGIYGRPQVNLNMTLYLISAIGMFKAETSPWALWLLVVPMSIFGVAYAVVLLRGPLDGPTNT
jgi:hypothetical protein